MEIILDYTDLPLKIVRQSKAEEKTREMAGRKDLAQYYCLKMERRRGPRAKECR